MSVSVGGSQQVFTLFVRLPHLHTVSGTVLSARTGSPVAHASVYITTEEKRASIESTGLVAGMPRRYSPADSVALARTHTDSQGRFSVQVAAVDEQSPPVLVVLDVSHRQWSTSLQPHHLQMGEPIVAHVEPSPVLRVHTVAGSGGTRIVPRGATLQAIDDMRQSQRVEGGSTMEFSIPASGEAILSIDAPTGFGSFHRMVRLDNTEDHEITVRLKPEQRQVVRVVRPDGTPVESCRVTLIRKENEKLIAEISSELTDDQGMTSLGGGCRGMTYIISCESGETPRYETEPVQLFDVIRTITLRVGGELEVLLTPAAAVRALRSRALAPSVVLSRRVQGRAQHYPDGRLEVDAKGRAHCSGVPPGRWLVRAIVYEDGDGKIRRRLCAMPRSVDVRAAETTRVRLKVTTPVPGSVSGRVTIDGQPHRGALLWIPQDPNGKGTLQTTQTNVEGRFSTDIPCGLWTPVAVRFGMRIPAAPVSIEPGPRRFDFRLSTHETRLQLVSRDGSPAVGVRLRVTNALGGRPSLGLARCESTDADGYTTLVGAAGNYRIHMAGTSDTLTTVSTPSDTTVRVPIP